VTETTGRLSAIGSLVRASDPDRFFCTLFAVPSRREALFALYAFNHELARVREVVSEPMLGEIRLQWWREALDGIAAGTPRRHDVVEALAANWESCDRALLDAMIDGRRADLAASPPLTLDALGDYGAATAGNLLRQAAGVLGMTHAGPDGSCGDAGRAMALSGVLRSTGALAQQGRTMLPAELLEPVRLEPRDILREEHRDRISGVVKAVCVRAEQHLRAARQARREVPEEAVPAFLPLAFAAHDLATLKRNGYNPFDPAFLNRSVGRQLSVLWRSLMGRF